MRLKAPSGECKRDVNALDGLLMWMMKSQARTNSWVVVTATDRKELLRLTEKKN